MTAAPPHLTPVTTDHAVAGVLTTPAGDIAVVATPAGVVLGAGYGPLEALAARLTSGGAGAADATGAVRRVPWRVEHGPLPASVVDAVARYGDGDVGALAAVPVHQPGGAFFQAAWLAMREVPPGSTVTYAELALAAGRPAAVRAAGSACARNLVVPFVPCHRVVRSGGSLGGYLYGLTTKEALLEHERRVIDVGRVRASG